MKGLIEALEKWEKGAQIDSLEESEQRESFIDLLEIVFQKQREYLSSDWLEEASQKDIFQYGFILNRLNDALETQQAWLVNITHHFDSPQLTEYTRDLFKVQQQEISDTNTKIQTRQDEIKRLEKAQPELEKEQQEIESLEERLSFLLENKNHFLERKHRLEQVKKEVESGRLEQLAEEVKQLQQQLAPLEQEIDLKIKERDTLLETKRSFEERLQLLLDQHNLLGGASSLMEETMESFQVINQQLAKKHQEEIEILSIRLAFNKKTSTDLLDKSNQTKIEDLTKSLVEIERAITKSIK